MASGSSFPQPPQPPSPYPSPSSPYGSPSGAPGEYAWLAPASLPQAAGAGFGGPAGSRPAAMYELRPLSTGEVLDRTFSLFRSHFLLFAGISSLSAFVQLLGQAAHLVIMHGMMKGRTDVLSLPLNSGFQVANNLLGFATSIVFLLAFAITQAATIWAMSEVYLGRSATVSGSLRATSSRWLRYLGIALWQLGSMLWLPVVFAAVTAAVWFADGHSFGGFGGGTLLFLLGIASIVGGVLFYLRNLLAVPVTVREGLGVRASMRRSKTLSSGGKGKLFLVLLIAFALYMVIATLAGVAVALTAVAHRGNVMSMLYPAQIIGIVMGFVGYSVISPVVMICTGLVYFDQRVRREAFDVAVLLGEETAGPLGAPAASPTMPPMLSEAPGFVAAESVASAATASATYAPPVQEIPPLKSLPRAEPGEAEPPVAEPEGGATGL